jgi:hypothetical protein
MPLLPLRCRAALAALLLLAVVLQAVAAPAPGKTPPPPLDKYLPDDTDLVVLVNAKELVASPLFAGQRKLVEKLLLGPKVQAFFKSVGVDPLKDVERVALVAGRSCHDNPPNSGPVWVFTGKFDVGRMRAGLTKLTKGAGLGSARFFAGGDGTYQITGAGTFNALFLAPLDDHTVILAARKEHALEAVARAAGKKKGKLTSAAVLARLKKHRPEVAFQMFALEQTIVSSGSTTETVNGQVVTRMKHDTLGDSGCRELEISILVKNDAQARMVLTVKSVAKLNELSGQFRMVLDIMKRSAEQEAATKPKLKPLAKFLNGVTIKAADSAVILEARASAEVVQGILELIDSAR